MSSRKTATQNAPTPVIVHALSFVNALSLAVPPTANIAPAHSAPAAAPNASQQTELAAYYRWIQRNRPIGDPETDWYDAEKALHGGDEDGCSRQPTKTAQSAAIHS